MEKGDQTQELADQSKTGRLDTINRGVEEFLGLGCVGFPGVLWQLEVSVGSLSEVEP